MDAQGRGPVSRSYGMNVQVHAVQDAMPEGMERVLNILEQVATAEVNPYNAIKAIEQITQTTAFEPDVTLEGVGQIDTVSQTDDEGLATKGAGYNYTKSFYFDLKQQRKWCSCPGGRAQHVGVIQPTTLNLQV